MFPSGTDLYFRLLWVYLHWMSPTSQNQQSQQSQSCLGWFSGCAMLSSDLPRQMWDSFHSPLPPRGRHDLWLLPSNGLWYLSPPRLHLSPGLNSGSISFYILFYFENFTYLLLDRGEWREKERERNIDEWEKHQWVASCTGPNGNLP